MTQTPDIQSIEEKCANWALLNGFGYVNYGDLLRYAAYCALEATTQLATESKVVIDNLKSILKQDEKDIIELLSQLNTLQDTSQLQQELEELRKDKRRMDWLEINGSLKLLYNTSVPLKDWKKETWETRKIIDNLMPAINQSKGTK